MAKGQKKTSREAKKERTADRTDHKGPKYLEGSQTSAIKLPIPKKTGKS